MSVCRIEFEDRGQDVLWWEIDADTGRIVGCGPLQAGLWASGDIRVDLDTISVGVRPRTFHRHEAKARTLNHVIAGFGPAPAAPASLFGGQA
jgi:hypothetical protein